MLRPYSIPLVASFTLVALLLASCSDSGDNAAETTLAPPTTEAATTTTAPTTTAPTTTVAPPETATIAEAVASPPDSRVLFVGNSLSYTNGGVEQHVELLAASANPPLIIQTEAIFRPAELASNWEYVSQRGSIEPGAYDMVVLQSSLQGAIQVATFQDAVRSFAEHITEAGAEPVLFMAWPIERYGVDPISMEEIAEAHQDIAAELDVRVAPVCLAWQRAMEERPEIGLYAPDQNHPSLLGTYLAAAVILGTIYGEDLTDLDYLCQDCVTILHPDGLTEDEARFLQRIAGETLQEYQQAG